MLAHELYGIPPPLLQLSSCVVKPEFITDMILTYLENRYNSSIPMIAEYLWSLSYCELRSLDISPGTSLRLNLSKIIFLPSLHWHPNSVQTLLRWRLMFISLKLFLSLIQVTLSMLFRLKFLARLKWLPISTILWCTEQLASPLPNLLALICLSSYNLASWSWRLPRWSLKTRTTTS